MLQAIQQENTTVWKCEGAQQSAVMGFSPAKHTPQTGSTVPGLKSKDRGNKHMHELPGQKAVLALE